MLRSMQQTVLTRQSPGSARPNNCCDTEVDVHVRSILSTLNVDVLFSVGPAYVLASSLVRVRSPKMAH